MSLFKETACPACNGTGIGGFSASYEHSMDCVEDCGGNCDFETRDEPYPCEVCEGHASMPALLAVNYIRKQNE